MLEAIFFLIKIPWHYRNFKKLVAKQSAELTAKHGLDIAVEYRKKQPQTFRAWFKLIWYFKFYVPPTDSFSLEGWRNKTLQACRHGS
jgi:hypothetical protein